MQSVLSRIWTCGAVSISYDDNHYTTGTSTFPIYNSLSLSLYIYIYIYMEKIVEITPDVKK